MSDDHARLAHLDAAYALGALEPGEAVRFEAHLTTCGECRARVAEARDTLAVLSALGDDAAPAAHGPEPVPDTLLPGLLRRVARERMRRRGLLAAGVTVVAACVTAVLVVFWPSASGPAPQRAVTARDFTPLRATPVRANASLISTDWGTQIDVHCSYAVGVRKAYRYSLQVVAADGAPESAGGWKVEPDHDVSYVGGTSVDLRDIRYVQILAPDGTAVLRLTP